MLVAHAWRPASPLAGAGDRVTPGLLEITDPALSRADGARLLAVGDRGRGATVRLLLGSVSHDAVGRGLPGRGGPHRRQPPEVPVTTASAPTRSDMTMAVRAAVRAPSLLNTQPWRFRLRGGAVEVLADPARRRGWRCGPTRPTPSCWRG